MANSGSEGLRRRGKVLQFPVSRSVRVTRNGGDMTIHTIFKEFVEENGIEFCLLDFGSRRYRSLVEAFNKVKLKLGAEEEALEYEKIRAWLMLKERSAPEDRRGRRLRIAAFQL